MASSPPEDPALSGTLSVMGFDTGGGGNQTRYELAAKAMDGVDLNLLEGRLNVRQLTSGASTGELPDLIYVDRRHIGTLASGGAIMPLDTCISNERIRMQNFLDTALSQVTFEGKAYGIPEFNQVQVLKANSELLAAADLQPADVDGSDWDRLAASAEAMAERHDGELRVIGFDPKLPQLLPLWVHANGGAMVSDDGRTAMLNTPEVVEALAFAASLYEVQGGYSEVTARRESTGFFGGPNQTAGTLGAVPVKQGDANVLKDVPPDAPVTFTTLKNKDGYPVSYSNGRAWAVPADSTNPAAACRFIKTMTATGTWVAAAETQVKDRGTEDAPFTGLFTANTAADQKIRKQFVDDGGVEHLDAAIEASYEANEHGFTLPTIPAAAQFRKAWQDAVKRALNGRQEPQQALDQAQREAQQALDKAWDSRDTAE
ncbi:extracellular solute-binding protein [Arthrobacter castelli]|uniref:extracellular solute-binding protein n=1 Tax=Arthrobacter castelli TaxID=271431 RepID=UPI001FE08E30|nr:extracellular solute-binding protein [Arthrobacter castelli]